MSWTGVKVSKLDRKGKPPQNDLLGATFRKSMSFPSVNLIQKEKQNEELSISNESLLPNNSEPFISPKKEEIIIEENIINNSKIDVNEIEEENKQFTDFWNMEEKEIEEIKSNNTRTSRSLTSSKYFNVNVSNQMDNFSFEQFRESFERVGYPFIEIKYIYKAYDIVKKVFILML